MDKEIEEYTRKRVLDGLSKLKAEHLRVFINMFEPYSYRDINQIDEVVNKLAGVRLEQALIVVRNSVKFYQENGIK